MSQAKGVTTRTAHTDGRGAMVFHPDGSQIITCGADTFVKVFDADNFAAEPRTIEHHESPVTSLAIKRSGKNIVTGQENHLVQYFGYPSCVFEKNITRAQSPIQAVAFDPKGKFVAVGSDDGVIRMCMTSMPQYTSLKSHEDSILTLAFDPKGEFLASSSADGTVKIWDITDEAAVVKTVRLTHKVSPGSSQRLRMAWHPTGSHLAVPYSTGVHILDRSTWEANGMLVNSHSKEVTHVAYSPNGQYLATCGLDRQVFVWQATTQESLDRHKNDIICQDVAWSPRDNALAFLDEAGQLHLWRQPTPSHLPSPTGDPNAVAEQAAAAADMAAANKADLLEKAAATVAAAAASKPEDAAVKTAGKSVFSLADDDDDGAAAEPKPKKEDDVLVGDDDDIIASGGGAEPKRRLRKVMHDSDDGGFSDHDDDEAAEAAMLAKELAKNGTGGGTAALAKTTAALAEAAKGKINAAALASAISGASTITGVAAQAVVHASATPAKNGRRFLLWNLTGMVLSRDENVFSAIEVEFNSIEKHRPIRLTDHYGFSMAALTDDAVVFASTSNNGNPSTIVYRPLASWAPNSDWQVQLDKGEEATSVALGHKWAAIATNKRYLRILSHTGAQRALVCMPANLVALAGHGGYLAAVTHSGRATEAADQSMGLALYDMRDPARPVKIATVPLPLSEGATLDWIGFSESGTLCSVDSAGIVRGCLRSYSYEWVPLLDCNTAKKAKNEHHWIVGLTDRELICVMCKGDDKFPATLPRPVTTPLALAMPLVCAEPCDPAVERERLLNSLLVNEFRATAMDDGIEESDQTQASLLKSFTKLDAFTLKLLAAACKAERTARALDLATQLHLPKSLASSLKLANHYKLGALAERISKLMESRFDGEEEEDVEAAPPPPAPRVAPSASRVSAPAPTAPRPADDDDDDDGADGEDEGDGGADTKAPINPFAKGANNGAGTVKGPKRALPVTAAVGGGKKMKK